MTFIITHGPMFQGGTNGRVFHTFDIRRATRFKFREDAERNRSAVIGEKVVDIEEIIEGIRGGTT